MNFYLFITIIVVTITAFGCGVIIGIYEIFPSEKLDHLKSYLMPSTESKTDFIPEIYDDESSISDRISINSEEDLLQKRSEMIGYIWMGSGFPTRYPEEIDRDVKISGFNDMKTLEKIDKFTVIMDFGENENKLFKSKDSEMTSIAYLFQAKNQKRDLIIYHQGHAEQSISDGENIIQFFLDNGYSILVFSMPAREENNEPIVNMPKFGKLKLATHNHFKLIDNEFFHPIKFFFEPIAVTLNYVEEYYDYQHMHMIGISGGGWTTVAYSALDPRISQSYPVAGAFPMYMRTTIDDLGDYEQNVVDFYEIVNYEELFVMDGYGENRKSIQIFNYNDPCCFQAEIYEKFPYGETINEKLTQLGAGEFRVMLDKSAVKHEITDFALKTILFEIEN